MAVLDVVGVDGAEALQRGGGERDAGGAADVLQLLHQADALLEHTVEEQRLWCSEPRDPELVRRFHSLEDGE